MQTKALGLSAAEVESLITLPMEADLLNGVAWLQQIYSESVAGLSSILLVFEPGTSHPEMVRISQIACQELQTIDGVRNCGFHIGQALLMDEVYGIYFGENWISVDPSVDYDETLAKVQSMVNGYPGLR